MKFGWPIVIMNTARQNAEMRAATEQQKSLRDRFIEVLSLESGIAAENIQDSDNISTYFNESSPAAVQSHICVCFGVDYTLEGVKTVQDGIEKLEAHF